VTVALRLATRGSPLAVAQARSVAEALRAVGVEAELVVVETEGDRRQEVALSELAGRGVFTKEVQAAVLDGRADVAVHSAKDLPAVTPVGLVLAAVPERADPADALVGATLAVLAPGATVATGAPRRRALLLAERPDLNVVGLRGNIATRLAAVETRDIDAVVVAVAALDRLGLRARMAERLDPKRFVPQVGQGAIALECVAGAQVASVLGEIDDASARVAVTCERAFLSELGVGCDVPGGAHATWTGASVRIHGVLMTEDGAVAVHGSESGPDPDRAGRALADRLRRELDEPVAPR
jgi:hydroxymethylbilane synthase